MSKRVPESIGDRVRQARTLVGLSQNKLAALTGLPSSHARAIEERDNLRTDTAASIARTLGLSLDWLIVGTGPRPTRESVKAAVEAAEARVRAIRAA